QLERRGLVGTDANRDVVQAQVERETEIIILAENRSERTVEVAVRFRGIPGDFKVLLCAVPLEQRRVAKDAPTVISRIRGEILRNGRRSNERSGDREQQDGQTKAHDRINFSSRTGNGST